MKLGTSALVVVLLSAGIAACGGGGPERSVANFCSTLAQQKQQYLSTYDKSSDDPLGGLVNGLSAMGEIPVIFDRLDKVAPDDIEPDVAAVRDAFQKQIDSLGGSASDPLGALAGGLIAGLAANGPYTRVSQYIEQNCPGERGNDASGSAAAASTTTTSPRAAASAGWGMGVANYQCDVVGAHLAISAGSNPELPLDPFDLVTLANGTTLRTPSGGTPGRQLIAWDAQGHSSASVAIADLGSSPSGTTKLDGAPLLGTDADGTPWAIYSATTTVAGTGLQADQVTDPISAFRLDDQGRAWQVDGLLGAPRPVDPNVSVSVFSPQAISGHVVVGLLSGGAGTPELVALNLSDGSVAWRRSTISPSNSFDSLEWQVADGALFLEVAKPAGSSTADQTEIDDPDTDTSRGTFEFWLPDSTIAALPQQRRWMLVGYGRLVVVDAAGAVIARRDANNRDVWTDQSSGIVVVSFQDGHFEAIDTTTGATAWSVDAGLARNTELEVTGAGDGYVSATTKTGAITLDARTGEQVWTGTLTAAAPLGQVVKGRLLTCKGMLDATSSSGTAALSIPVTKAPLGLDHDTPIYP